MTSEAQSGWTRWPAPAKLNLMLRIVGRESDGYHRIQTVFQLLDWGDTVRLRIRGDGAIRRVGPDPGYGEDVDLALRAARALQRATGCRLGADIRVDKRIPPGGGFGGGSSDAASVLVGLDRLWRVDAGAGPLAEIALGLGADVPVFVHGRSAWAEGRGERLQPISLMPRWYLLVDPGVGIPTPELFATADLTRDAPAATISDFVSGRCTGNVFQPIVAAREPAVAGALAALAAFGTPRMSGTGSGCFVELASRAEAEAGRVALAGAWRCWVARGVARSALLSAHRTGGGGRTTGASPSG